MFVLLPLHSEDYRSHNPLQNNIIDNLILEESILRMNMYICTVCLPMAMFFYIIYFVQSGMEVSVHIDSSC